MDLQLKKIHFVQEFLRLEDINIINKLEGLLRLEKSKLNSTNTKAYSEAEINTMIDNAENDFNSKRVKSIKDLKKDINTWL